tara:strand:- start:236 stop:532 length:297 start_codon:yes stop_codon:yes gene_type:complete
MNITRRQLRELIYEAVSSADFDAPVAQTGKVTNHRNNKRLRTAALGYAARAAADRLGGIEDLEIIAGGSSMPEVVSWTPEEADLILMIVNAINNTEER